MKKTVPFILLLIFINITMASCQLAGDFRNPEQEKIDLSIYNNDDVIDSGPVNGGTLKLFSTTPDTLNPILTKNCYVSDFCTLIFESMIKMDKNQNPVPFLCDDWEVSEDGLVWNFHIRDDVLWHDNIPLTAEDIEFTIETILKSNVVSVYKKNLQNITTFAAINKNTVRLVLRKPNSFTAGLMTFPIIPKHCYSGKNVLESPQNWKPVGTGPYKYKAFNDNKKIILDVNENWWNATNGSNAKLPYINEIEISIYKNAKYAVDAFHARDIDLVFLETYDFNKYNGRTDMMVKKFPGRNFEFIAFNLSNPLLQDKSLRQAINISIDVDKIINNLLPGKVIVSKMPVVPESWIYDSHNEFLNADREKAKSILEQNGYKGTGIRSKSISGKKMSLDFELLVNEGNTIRMKIAEEIKEQLKITGINIRITKVKWEEEFKKIDSGKYDMVIIGSRVPSIPDVSYLYSDSYLNPYSQPDIDIARNIAGYENNDVNNYINKIFSINEEDNIKTTFSSMVGIINDEVPYLGLFFYNNAMLCSNRIRGNIDPYEWSRFNRIEEWYIPQR